MSLFDRYIIWRARRRLARLADARRKMMFDYAKRRTAAKLGHARKRGAA